MRRASAVLSPEADAALATDLGRVYVGDGQQQRHIVLGELQRVGDVAQPARIRF